jgi:hypothetical protein
MPISDFYQGTTKNFTVTILKNNVYPDIRNDEVILYINYVSGSFTSSADVTTSGSAGEAIFNITPSQTEDIEPGVYRYELYWQSGSAFEYVLEKAELQILDRISQ